MVTLKVITYGQCAKGAILTHNPKMRRILIVGCGDIALRVARILHKKNSGRYRLFGLVRNATRLNELRALGIIPMLGNLDDAKSLRRLAGLADIVLHFAPPPTLNISFSSKGGVGRGVKEKNGVNTDTRTHTLLAILAQGILPRRLVYISTSGVYGDCGGATISETFPLNAQTARAQRRINAEQQIRAWAKRNHVNANILRVPGIYAADRLPLDRLRAGTPAIVQQEDSYTNHIHADDLARIVIAALHNSKPNRIYHASDDSQMKMGDYFDAVADAHHLPRPPRLPRTEVERAVSPMLWTFMNESRRLTNARMKRELKVKLRYPDVRSLMQEIIFDKS